MANSNNSVVYGRGGAGNIAKEGPVTPATEADLTTPTLKGEHYTTGRGGAGNIARNDPQHPELARASQDVDAPKHREVEGPHHVGRGGAANAVKPSAMAKAGSEEPQRKSNEGEAKREDGSAGAGKNIVGKVLDKIAGKKEVK